MIPGWPGRACGGEPVRFVGIVLVHGRTGGRLLAHGARVTSQMQCEEIGTGQIDNQRKACEKAGEPVDFFSMREMHAGL